MTKNLPVSGTVSEGDIIKWEGFVIEVLETPGATDGSVSYVVTHDDLTMTICFSGDVTYGGGQVFDLYSLQKGFTTRDYHGFMGNVVKLIESMKKLDSLKSKISMLVPSHGDLIVDPQQSIGAAIDSLDELYENYCSISSINYYFPDCLADIRKNTEMMEPAVCADLPDYIKHVGFTTFALVSDSGLALIIDCGCEKVINILRDWIMEGIIGSIEGCWVTHYHDDHVDFIRSLVSEFSCPVITTADVAEVIQRPSGFFLPCISPEHVHVDKIMPDGYSWQWNEFTLTAMHLPGQTLYHSGLLVEGHDMKILLAGDSFSPNGIDDYCSGNRNFSGEGRGYRYCIDILRKCRPDYILNQHQLKVFRMTDDNLDFMEKKLIEREKIFSRILPWNDPNFGLDEWWVRTYPYEQSAVAGSRISIEVRFMNHHIEPITAHAGILLPDGWELIVPSLTSESVILCGRDGNSDGSILFQISIPPDAPENMYMLVFRISCGERYLGQFRHAVVSVISDYAK